MSTKRQDRTVTWGDWAKFEKMTGLAPPKKKNKNKKKLSSEEIQKKRESFCKCKKCGGTMDFLENVNAFICRNEVEKEVSKIDKKTGKETKEIIKTICGNYNIVEDKYIDYVKYLFLEAKV